ncbi:DUF2461 family protein [Pedobacter petrophilus]|uniref:DUF2461 family protein n=1 Tax=Pedobacter petrophilus TaxID=1908241 RepID=A0A7K0G2B8_9SPHI|nr:DUF2461 family protein [Pedobacter petrophilus]MRX77963.1 DUF2461 family protein [Pedobacter petrophilus]
MRKTLEFLQSLQGNNNASWFLDHIGEYERAKAELDDLAYALVTKLTAFDEVISSEIDSARFISSLTIPKPKKKQIYYSHFDIAVSPLSNGGNEPVYLVHLDPEGSYFSIRYDPDVFGIQVMRSYLTKNLIELESILAQVSEVTAFELNTDSAKGPLPKGYQPGVPGERFLKLTSYEIRWPMPDPDLKIPKLADTMSIEYQKAYPFMLFLRKGLGL